MGPVPDVRIGIVSYDTPMDLNTCLEGLSASTEGLRTEVVVVDNGSVRPDDSAVTSRHHVRLIRLAENVGYPRAMNHALAGTAAPVLLALNPDTRAGPGSLTSLVERLTADTSIGLVGPNLVGTDGLNQHSAQALPSPAVALATGFVPPRLRKGWIGERFWLEGHARLDSARDVDWMVGAVHCIRREAVLRPRVYSERAFMYGEDMELCWFVRRAGWRVVFDPSVQIMHIGNVTGARNFGASREVRWLDATYDWYASARGEAAARRWAAANVAGLLVKAGALRFRSDEAHRAFVRTLLAFHARRVLRPLGDLHSRNAPDGRAPADPVVAYDSGNPAGAFD